MFVILDGPLMIAIAIGMISVYLWVQSRRVKKQMSIISCCFLVIGQGTFLKEPDLLEDNETKKSAERYYLLEWLKKRKEELVNGDKWIYITFTYLLSSNPKINFIYKE